mmetsp:Transcript_26115/g.69511  ORF Transcript_26115/g.69511 Transcript_26115/m.69511 type:complete len:105 (-) Transcript_26115:453-767(-)
MDVLTTQQQDRLNQAKARMRIENEEYLRQHPELQTFISMFMSKGMFVELVELGCRGGGRRRRAGFVRALLVTISSTHHPPPQPSPPPHRCSHYCQCSTSSRMTC